MDISDKGEVTNWAHSVAEVAVTYGDFNADYVSAVTGWPADDISMNIMKFRAQSNILGSLDMQMPCVNLKHFKDEERHSEVPIDLEDAIKKAGKQSVQLGRSRQNIRAEIAKSTSSLAGQGLHVVYWPVEYMRQAFIKNVKNFIEVRAIKASRFWGEKPAIPEIGLKVKVISRNKGLRILYSDTLIFKDNQGFGEGLSTPVVGSLPPGMYTFGAMGGDLSAPIWEGVVEQIPPNLKICLTRV